MYRKGKLGRRIGSGRCRSDPGTPQDLVAWCLGLLAPSRCDCVQGVLRMARRKGSLWLSMRLSLGSLEGQVPGTQPEMTEWV